MVRLTVFSFLLLLSSLVDARRAQDDAWTFTLRFENDLFADTDRNYTNGIKLSWISPDLKWFRDSDKLPDWGKRIIRHVPFSQEKGLQRNIAFSLGQKIFTPADTRRNDLIKDDRPYAGWFYFSTALHNKDYRHLDTFELQAGVIGDWSFAEETQNLVHDVRGIASAKGWENQLENEAGLVLFYEHKDRVIQPMSLAGLGFDVITHYGGAVGNVYTYLNAGLEMRVGWNLPTDFGTSLIRPGGETNAPSDTKDPRFQSRNHAYSLHAFAAVTGRWVLRDIFLDGNTFSDSHEVEREALVGDFIIGASLIVQRLKVSYAQVFRSKEFNGQSSGHHFGSISVSYTY